MFEARTRDEIVGNDRDLAPTITNTEDFGGLKNGNTTRGEVGRSIRGGDPVELAGALGEPERVVVRMALGGEVDVGGDGLDRRGRRLHLESR